MKEIMHKESFLNYQKSMRVFHMFTQSIGTFSIVSHFSSDWYNFVLNIPKTISKPETKQYVDCKYLSEGDFQDELSKLEL